MTQVEETNAEGQPDQRVIMEIILTKTGDIQVRGLIDDKTMCLGIIEVAKLKLQDHWKSLETKLVKPNGGIINFMRHGHK